MSPSAESQDTTDRHSDLAVEVGSGLYTRRNDRSLRRAFKRRAADDSSDDQNRNGCASQNGHDYGQTSPFPSRLSIDSSNPDGSRSSSARKKIRSCQAYPCRPATCPVYRTKNFSSGHLEGKTLKLQLCKASNSILDRRKECKRSSELFELRLPCKLDDLIAEIAKAHPISNRSFFAQRRKKFRAAMMSVCFRINEILGKIGRKEIGRCRLHCEILPGFVSFRLIQRDRYGCEVCLFNDRAPIDRIDDRLHEPIRSSSTELGRIGEQKSEDDAERAMYENTGFSPINGGSCSVGSLEEEAAIKTGPENILIRLSDDDLDAAARKNVEQLIEQTRRQASNRWSENKLNEPICSCNPSFDDVGAGRGKEDNENGDHEPKNNQQESIGEQLLNRSNGNAIVDYERACDDHVDIILDRTGNTEYNNNTGNQNNSEELPGDESLIRFNENLAEDKKCTCSISSEDHLDTAIEADHILATDGQASGVADMHEEIADVMRQDAAENDQTEKLQQIQSRSSSLKKIQPGPLTDNQVDEVACACPMDCSCPNRRNEENQPEDFDSQSSCSSCREDEPRPLNKTEMSSLLKTLDSGLQDSRGSASTQKNEAFVSATEEIQRGYVDAQTGSYQSQDLEFHQRLSMRSGVPTGNQLDEIACSCPTDCICLNRCAEENQPEECDSQCSCGSCHREDEPRPLKKTEIIRMSSLLKTLDSRIRNPPGSTSTRMSESLVSAREENQSGDTEARTRSAQLQNFQFPKQSATKSDEPIDVSTEMKSSIEVKTQQPQRHHPTPAARRSTSAAQKSPRNLSPEEHPVASARLSRTKGQRINISIELCPESESSTSQTQKNEPKNAKEFKARENVSSLLKPRRHSVQPQPFENQVHPQPDQDTRDEFLRHPGFIDTGVHSPPRPLESRDYLPSFRPPSSLRNPIVYGTSTKSRRLPISKMDVRSPRDGRQRGGDSGVTKNRHVALQRSDKEEMPKIPRGLSKPDAFSSSGRNSVGHAFSASSVDRMKHLIRTKLRRMLLERDKATNTPKTTLTNKKYRVSVPVGKTDRSRVGQQPCRTIWESRSASDSVHTSRTFASADRISPAEIHGQEEVKKLFQSTGNQRIPSSTSRDDGRLHRGSNSVNSSRNCETGQRDDENDRRPEVDLDTDFRRLAGGSDLGLRKKPRKYARSSVKEVNRCASQNKNGRLGEEKKVMNRSLKEVPEEIGDSSARVSREASGKKITQTDETTEFCGKLDWSGNSTSRHIYLLECEQFESSNDETESQLCCDSSPKICFPNVRRRAPGRSIDSCSQKFISSARRDESSMSNCSCNMDGDSVDRTRWKGAFGHIDQDLRRKLLQYVSLCKNVKYSLLKRLRPDDIYEVSRTSIPCCDRYKFGDT